MNIPIYTSNPTTTEYQILERKNFNYLKSEKKRSTFKIEKGEKNFTLK